MATRVEQRGMRAGIDGLLERLPPIYDVAAVLESYGLLAQAVERLERVEVRFREPASSAPLVLSSTVPLVVLPCFRLGGVSATPPGLLVVDDGGEERLLPADFLASSRHVLTLDVLASLVAWNSLPDYEVLGKPGAASFIDYLVLAMESARSGWAFKEPRGLPDGVGVVARLGDGEKAPVAFHFYRDVVEIRVMEPGWRGFQTFHLFKRYVKVLDEYRTIREAVRWLEELAPQLRARRTPVLLGLVAGVKSYAE